MFRLAVLATLPILASLAMPHATANRQARPAQITAVQSAQSTPAAQTTDQQPPNAVGTPPPTAPQPTAPSGIGVSTIDINSTLHSSPIAF